MYIETANSSLIIIFMRMDVSSGTEKTTLRRNGRCGQPAYISSSIAWIGANTILFHRNKQGISKQKIGHQTIRKPLTDSAGIDRGAAKKQNIERKMGRICMKQRSGPFIWINKTALRFSDFPGRKPANGLTPYRSVVIMGCEITGNTEDERIDRAGLYQIPQNVPAVEGRT